MRTSGDLRCELYDAGTRFLPLAPHLQTTPGMEAAGYRPLDMEYDWGAERTGEINAAMMAQPGRVTLTPWPQPFPGVSWVDYTARYYGAKGGPTYTLYCPNAYGPGVEPAPANAATIAAPSGLRPEVERVDERIADMATVAEYVAADPASPTPWLRLPLDNERTYTTDLKQPAAMRWRALNGPEYLLAQESLNPLFCPFDLRETDWYVVHDSTGRQLPQAQAESWLRMKRGGVYRVYLRPATWRWVATVKAWYLYVSWFEMFEVFEVFTKAWYDRPPFYPERHDILNTSLVPVMPYEQGLYCWDDGINRQFELSRGAATLARWIIEAQWHTMCQAYIFTSNDDAIVTIWQHPPDRGDVVLGLGRVDYPGSTEERVWIRQVVDVEDRWPRSVVATYYVPFWVDRP